ncbi:MAG: PAS domain-containing protein [Sphingopyxis solisilvae]|uniref:PAS domain-containing protein n=1 Tax=Sphingopyxis solisilvae TaxID=1886788 RepID=UPI0040360634
MATVQEPHRVSAADFIRGFANWRLQSARSPVVVTHHGKDAHVLISLDDYRRLGPSADGGGRTPDWLQQSLAPLVESLRDAIILMDRDWRIAAINPAACDMVEMACADLVGQPLSRAVPSVEGSLLVHHIVRLLDHRERFSGEVPDLLRPRQWTQVDLIPLPVGGAIVLRDITAAIDENRSADACRVLLGAIEAEGSIGHARLSVRETVEDANAALTAMVGVDRAAITRVRFSALLPISHRAAFGEALETVFRTGQVMRIASQLATRDGGAIDVQLSIAERRGRYASDGAVVLVTRRSA